MQTAKEESGTKKLGESVIRLRFNVFRLFGHKYAVYNTAVPELLDVACLAGKPSEANHLGQRRIALYALHHRAYEIGLFDVDPMALQITTPFNGPDADSLKITCSDLSRVSGHSSPD